MFWQITLNYGLYIKGLKTECYSIGRKVRFIIKTFSIYHIIENAYYSNCFNMWSISLNDKL